METKELTRIQVQEKEYIVEQRRNKLVIETANGAGIVVEIGPSGIFRIEGSGALDVHLESANSFRISHR